ncbi:hypothetical protein H0H92_002188 [Tricholoma furcatifolium]|nr:hypothetical protein H0H92_002188 [Tricholoma furcatifolium]
MHARKATVTEAIDGTNAMKSKDDDYLPPEKWFLTAADNFKKTRKLEKRLRKEKRRLEQNTEQNKKVENNEDTKTHKLRTTKKTRPRPAPRRSLRTKSTSGKDDVASQCNKTEASQKKLKRKKNVAQEEVVMQSVKKVKFVDSRKAVVLQDSMKDGDYTKPPAIKDTFDNPKQLSWGHDDFKHSVGPRLRETVKECCEATFKDSKANPG